MINLAWLLPIPAPAEPVRAEPVVAAPVRAGLPASARIPRAGRSGLRAYKAARPDRLAGFSVGFYSSGEDIRRGLRGLIAHSREAAQNIDYARNFEAMIRRHVIGPGGIALQMDVRERGIADKAANELIESAWKAWGRLGSPSLCGRLSWLDLQNVAAVSCAREGNFLLRFHRGRAHGRFAFRVQPISIDHLDLDYHRGFSGGSYVAGGIEFDGADRPIAYHLFDAEPGAWARGPSLRRVRVPASEILHLFRPVEAMQSHGAPWMHTALRRLNLTGQFEESALAAAHYGAAQMGWFKTPEDDGPRPEAAGDDEAPADEIEAGTLGTLPPGWDYVAHNPKYPDAQIGPFLKHMLRGAATGLGVSYASLTGDLEGANFSSLRAGLSEERDEWRTIQKWIAEHFHARIFSEWLAMALLSGAIPLPVAKLDKFDAATWRPRGWAAVNPAQEATATEGELRMGIAAPSDVAAARGQDFEEIVRRRKRDRELLAEAGDPAAAPGAPAGAAPPAGPPGLD